MVNGTSQQGARSLAGEGSLASEGLLAILNFASARNPGGGFLNGTKAQEEDLCRCCGPNPTIVRHDQKVATLLLGAWGCGAFRGDPVMSSRTARQAIESQGAGLERIVFAIPGKGKQSRHNLETFVKTLST